MQEECYRKICEGREVRENLIRLRQLLEAETARRQFAYRLGGDFCVLTALLSHEDPKVRKNAALILGEMETEDVLPFLFAAWEGEETRFVRTAYLKAMLKLDCRPYLGELRDRAHRLETMQTDEESAKHVREELACLRKLLLPYEGSARHHFLRGKPLPEVLLVTSRCVTAQTALLVTEGTARVSGSAVRVRGGSIDQLGRIRTWQEMLFPIPGGALEGNPQTVGRQLAARRPDRLLDQMHEGDGPWRYRLERRGAPERKGRGDFLRAAAGELDRGLRGRLVNSPSDYEVEIRLLERRDGTFLPFLKLFTLRDERFCYRREYIADSLTPVNGAVIMELARPWLREGARVLDPFCGAGTLLTERCYAGRVGSAYGTDIFGEAVEKARRNAKCAGMPIHYVHRDFFTFTHEQPFDEVITDIPRGLSASGQGADAVFARFLAHLPSLLAQEALVLVYTLEPEMVRRQTMLSACFREEQAITLHEKSGASLFMLRQKR